jgi:hypothetical protein
MLALKKAVSRIVENRSRSRKNALAKGDGPAARDPILRDFADRGYHVFRSYCDASELDRLRRRYLDDVGALPSQDGNIAMPFFDPQFMSRFFESNVWSALSTYGRAVYGRAPVLQIYPSIVVTKPTFSQGEFVRGTHRVPASYHTDYPSEMTVHIPLTDITAQTNHTRFCVGSHRAAKVSPRGTYAADATTPYEHVELFANAGDLLALDVTGIHRADVVQDSLRVMIQLKFTVPRYVIAASDIGKAAKHALASGAFVREQATFREDLEFAMRFAPAQQLDRSSLQLHLAAH